MGSADHPGQQPPQQQKSDFALGFERAVTRARWYGLAEKFWERAAPTVGGVTGVFLTASWLGMWQNMPPSMRAAGVMMFAAALAYAVKPLFKLRLPDRNAALRRMDAANGEGRPATTYDELPAEAVTTPPQTAASAGGKTLWQLERDRIEQQVGSFKAGLPRSSLVRRDPYALRFALALAAGVSLFAAHSQGEAVERVAAAFDWRIGIPDYAPLVIDAWVTAPDYSRQPPMLIASKEKPGEQAAGDFTIPARSVMTLTVHDRIAVIDAQGGMTAAGDACRKRDGGAVTQCRFEFSDNARVVITRPGETPVDWRFKVTPDLPPRVTVTVTEPAGEGNIAVGVDVEDEYGATVPEVRISPADTPAEMRGDPGTGGEDAPRPLPLYNGPIVIKP